MMKKMSEKIFYIISKRCVKTASVIIFFIIFIMMYNSTSFSQETPHYCDDQEQWQKWKNLVEEYPDDDHLAIGYALRIGLCQQIKNHTIETERAIILFDRYMNALKDATALEERKAKRLESKNSI